MRRIVALALLAATTVAIAAGTTAWRRVDQPLAQRGTSTEPDFDAFHVAMVEGMRPQARAEAVLQMAINGYSGASDYAIANAQSWRGEVEPTATLEAMLETALASPRIEVRMAALEVTIARSDLAKTAQQVDALVAQRRADPGDYNAWALWSLGAIGARGVARERVLDELLLALQDSDAGRRKDAVEALAVFGGEEIIAPLLTIAARDPDSLVQERAFCALAQSATLHIAERETALPGLLAIAGARDASVQTRSWSYQAMREISGLTNVPEDPGAWQRALDAAGLRTTIAR